MAGTRRGHSIGFFTAHAAAMSTAFEKRLATIAQEQFDKYRWLRENQDPLASQVEAHWTRTNAVLSIICCC